MRSILKDVAIPVVSIFGAVGIMFMGIHMLTTNRRYDPREAASLCSAAGKRLGEFRYDFGQSYFTCVDAPLQ